jgi:hypothetical protein
MATERFGKLLQVGQEGFASLMAQSKPLNPSESIALPWGNELKALHLLTLPNRIAFEQADMFDCDVSQANLVFIYSTCFGAFMGKIAHKLAHELPDAALVSTTTYALNHPAFQLIKHFPAKTMAWTDVFVYIKLPTTEGSEKWPVPEEIQAAGHSLDPQGARDAGLAQSNIKLLDVRPVDASRAVTPTKMATSVADVTSPAASKVQTAIRAWSEDVPA